MNERDLAFQRVLDTTVNYFAAIEENGDTPWFDDPEKLAKLESRCPGISQHRGIEARRMLFDLRYDRPAPPTDLPADPRTPESYTEERAA